MRTTEDLPERSKPSRTMNFPLWICINLYSFSQQMHKLCLINQKEDENISFCLAVGLIIVLPVQVLRWCDPAIVILVVA